VQERVVVSAAGLDVEALFARYAPVVFRRARRLLGRDADAWDAVSEVFEKMTWVYRVTTNVALNQLRARGLREAAVHAEEPATGPEATEARQLLRVWMEHLTERELQVATLLYVEGLTQDEVAEVLGLSRKTIVREVAALREKAAGLGALPEELA
jgi:RNA polymerase sigma-70 factor, ECF subfamily